MSLLWSLIAYALVILTCAGIALVIRTLVRGAAGNTQCPCAPTDPRGIVATPPVDTGAYNANELDAALPSISAHQKYVDQYQVDTSLFGPTSFNIARDVKNSVATSHALQTNMKTESSFRADRHRWQGPAGNIYLRTHKNPDEEFQARKKRLVDYVASVTSQAGKQALSLLHLPRME